MAYRIVVCVDIDAKSFQEAYKKLYEQMSILPSDIFDWESSNEAYDDDGEQIDIDELQRVRMAHFNLVSAEV